MKVFKEQLQSIIQQGDHLIVAVSGGADSMALLHLLESHQESGNYTFEVAHVHHHLRAASDDEWIFVESYCQKHALAFHGIHLDVATAQAKSRKSMEAVAHELRLAALQEIVVKRQAKWLLLAHHANDRAETILMNILRGTGAKGLAAMPIQQGNIIRPLLAYTRDDIEQYCSAHQLSYVTDESNEDTRITRNRIRHELLPLLGDYNGNIVNTLNRLGDNMSLEQDFIRQCVQSLYETSVFFHAKKWCLLHCAPIAAHHEAIQVALIQTLAEKILGTRTSIHQDMLTHCVALIHKGNGRYDLGQGLVFEWTKQWCYIGFSSEEPWTFDGETWQHSFLEGAFQGMDSGFEVRTYQSGDTLYEKGIGKKSLKKIFQEQGFPITLRNVWPIVYNSSSKEIKYIPFLAPIKELVYDIKVPEMGKYSFITINKKNCFFKESFL